MKRANVYFVNLEKKQKADEEEESFKDRMASSAVRYVTFLFDNILIAFH